MSRINDIRKRYNDKRLTEDQYKSIKKHQIAQMRVDIKHLLYELDRAERRAEAAECDLIYASECHNCGNTRCEDHEKNGPMAGCTEYKWRGPQYD